MKQEKKPDKFSGGGNTVRVVSEEEARRNYQKHQAELDAFDKQKKRTKPE